VKVNAPPDGFLAGLPEIREIKTTLQGQQQEFRCRVLARTGAAVGDAVTVLFISDREYRVADLELPAGTITFGHFWSARPYNVYHWLTPEGRTLALYFNLSADTVIDETTLRWNDLAVDVLARPGVPPEVLDEADLPDTLDRETLMVIADATRAVLIEAPTIVTELEGRADRLWQRIWSRPRAR
jgi:predicted RNA-binding protein associated with RNAse of E/G family